MTTLHDAARMAIDAISDLKGYRDDIDEAIAALREALNAPEPEPVALESVHLTRDTRGMCVVRVNGRVAIRDNGDIIDHMATLEWFAAPPAAPAEDHATPSGGQEAGPQEDRIEAAYWRFDARRSGYARWKAAPMSERDAFKAEMRNALEAEKVRAEMRLVARGWRRPDTPAAPAPAAPVPDGWAMVPREPTPEMLAVVRNGPMHETWAEGYCAMIAASPAAPVPLTDEQIDKILERERMKWATSPPTYEFAASFARAIEAAHGITGGKP